MNLRPWKCTYPGCSYTCKLKGSLTVHMRLHEPDLLLRKPIPCTFEGCDYRTSQKSTLSRHVRKHHTPGRTRDFPYTLCPSWFFSKSELTAHIQNHLKEKVFECHFCEYKTHRSCYLTQHVGNVHENKTFACSFAYCDYVADNKYNRNRHLKMHDPNPAARRPFPCTFPGCEHRAKNQ